MKLPDLRDFRKTATRTEGEHQCCVWQKKAECADDLRRLAACLAELNSEENCGKRRGISKKMQ